MRKFLTMVTLLIVTIHNNAQTISQHDSNAPVGWGHNTTGGAGGDTIIVKNSAELKDALSKDSSTKSKKRVVFIDGVIDMSGGMLSIETQNKTIIGLVGAKFDNSHHLTIGVDGDHNTIKKKSGILILKNSNNVIIRNLAFIGSGAYDIDGNDNLTLQNCTNIWIDHCDFQDGQDGNLDCNNGSNNISITWCRFRYLNKCEGNGYWITGKTGDSSTGDHRFTNLWGGSDTNASKDSLKLNTTFQFCWWDEGCRERMPRVRFGKVHILNCLYSSSVANYCIGAGNESNIYVENTVFNTSSTSKAFANYLNTSKTPYATNGLKTIGCLFLKATSTGNIGTKNVFTPSEHYSYQTISADEVTAAVTGEYGAGNTLDFNLTTTAIPYFAQKQNVTKTEYFDLQGRKIQTPENGIYIIRQTMSDGTRRVVKTMK